VNGSTLLASLLAGSVTSALGCHRFEACGPGVACDSPGAGGENGGVSSAGSAGDTQAGCAGSSANCDLGVVNGCEVDLTSDPRHCSACKAVCAGICNDGECMPFEVAATNQVDPVGGIVLTSDFAYFAAERLQGGAASLRLQRVARRDLSDLQTLVEGHWSSIEGLAVTSRKLYVLGDNGRLFGLTLPEASELADEPYGTSIESIDGQGRYLYLSDYWSVYRRDEGDDAETRVFHSADATGVRVSASSDGFFVFAAYTYPPVPPRYEVLFGRHETVEPALVAAGEGTVTMYSAFEDDVFFVVADGPSFTLRHASESESEQVVATDAEHLTGLAASSANLVGAVSADFNDGLRVFSVDQTDVFHDWPTLGPVLALEADADGELWYFDSAALVRLSPYRFPVRP
jgi:hypothetical protein